MATFFDVDEDLYMLHESVRDHDERYTVADDVEWRILDFYKQREGIGVANYEDFWRYENGSDPDNEIKVRLVGYDQDTPANSSSDLKDQLKRAIAKGTSWVLRNYELSDGVKSISQGPRSVTYETVPSWDEFPDGIQSILKNYDARIAAYGI